MAQCPKCGKKLLLYHWRPSCPFCGVNMIYYSSNERLLQETEQAEIEHAKGQPRIDRAKAATIGSPQAIVRLILSVLPLGALFLPLGHMFSNTLNINAISIYRYLDRVGFLYLFFNDEKKTDIVNLLILLTMLSAFAVLIHLFCLPFSLGKRGKARNLTLNLIMLISGMVAVALFVVMSRKSGGMLDWGAFVYIGLLAAILVYNIILSKKGLPVKYTPCYIGGIPSDEYFAMVEAGVSELEIRKKMVEALTLMQEEAVRKAEEEQAALETRLAERA